jgi:hypothetical protein
MLSIVHLCGDGGCQSGAIANTRALVYAASCLSLFPSTVMRSEAAIESRSYARAVCIEGMRAARPSVVQLG